MQTVWKVVVGVLAAILVLLLLAEAGLRMYLANQITEGFAQDAGAEAAAEPDVSFGSQPVTLGLLNGRLPHVTVNAPSTLLINGDQISGNPAATVEMDNLKVTGGEAIAETFTMTTELPNDFLRAMINQEIQGQIGDNRWLNNVITVSEVSTNPDAGTFTIEFTSGAAGIELRPVNENGQLAFEAASTQLFGFTLPDEVASALSEAMADGMRHEVTGTLQVRDMTVVPGGLRVAMTGNNVNFEELQQGAPATQALPAYQP